jgi:hypothetical protein
MDHKSGSSFGDEVEGVARGEDADALERIEC